MNNMEYPCNGCIVGPRCTEVCTKVIKEKELLKHLIYADNCPDCGHDYLIGVESWVKKTKTSMVICKKCKSIFFIYLTFGTTTTMGSGIQLKTGPCVERFKQIPREQYKKEPTNISIMKRHFDLHDWTFRDYMEQILVPRIGIYKTGQKYLRSIGMDI